MVKKAIWIVYDFDLNGDLEGLYTWLDSNKAIECGIGVAFLYFEYQKNILKDLRKAIEETVELHKKDRIYVIYRDARKMKGNFLFGERKRNPWAGYAAGMVQGEEVDE